MKKTLIILLSATAIFYSCNKAPSIEWVVTTPDSSWIYQHQILEYVDNKQIDVEIDLNNPQQTIDGFGTCFNELGWTSLSALSNEDRESILKEMFEPGVGANFTICRMPVGANDFSREWYSYNETDGDFEMKNFTIANDMQTLVPFIRSAQKYNPALKVWGSPWSPPSWMKYNKHYACAIPPTGLDEKYHNGLNADKQGAEGSNMFVQEDAYFKAYALYFSKYVDAYKQQGIDIFAVMPQNEFNSCQIFPSCTWTATGLNKFVGEYLGPQIREQGVDVMFGTMERANTLLVDTVLQDTNSSKYIKGVGFQWAGKDAVGEIHENYPGLKIYQTEQECGDGKNDWQYCCYAWKLMKHYLNNGTNVYTYWNTLLDEGGVSRWGWSQNSLVSVDAATKTYKYNYEYYLMKHFSHYILPGAKRLSLSGDFANLIAFQNTNKSIVIIIQNDADTDKTINVKLADKQIAPTLLPNSFNTILIK